MTRVCFIGDSHLAALKFALSSVLSERPDIQPVFFAGPGTTMKALALSGTALVATNERLQKPLENTSGGLHEIRDEYDCFVLHGLELSIAQALIMVRERKSHDTHLPWKNDGAFRNDLASAIENTLAIKILTMLRQITSAPVFFSPKPISHAQFRGVRRRLAESRESEDLVRHFETLCSETGKSLTATFLPQPARTRDDDGVATKPDYSHLPSRFSVQQADEDKSHMNADYGAAVLQDFLAAASLS